jgi:hypothetical protein
VRTEACDRHPERPVCLVQVLPIAHNLSPPCYCLLCNLPNVGAWAGVCKCITSIYEDIKWCLATRGSASMLDDIMFASYNPKKVMFHVPMTFLTLVELLRSWRTAPKARNHEPSAAKMNILWPYNIHGRAFPQSSLSTSSSHSHNAPEI